MVGFSGTLKPWHGVECLLHAMRKLLGARSEARLLLIGEGRGRKGLERLCRELGLDGRVHFTGAVPHDEVADYLAAADVLVAPYVSAEHAWFSPLKVAEYRAVGRAVVASGISQVRESLGEAQGVVLVPPGDEDALAESLRVLARNPGRRQRLADAAAASSRWTWRDLVRQMLREGEIARRERWRWEA